MVPEIITKNTSHVLPAFINRFMQQNRGKKVKCWGSGYKENFYMLMTLQMQYLPLENYSSNINSSPKINARAIQCRYRKRY